MANQNERMKPFDFDFSQIEKPKPAAPAPAASKMQPFDPGQEFKEPPGVIEDTLKGGASGFATGLVGTPGIFGTARDISDLAFRKLASYPESWITGKPQEDIEKDIATQQQKYREGSLSKYIPNAQFFVEGARKLGMPHYEAQTVPGQYAQTVGEFVGGSGIGPGSLANKAMTGLGAGLTSETAGQLYKGTENEGLARFLGSIPGAIGGGAAQTALAARSPSAVQARAGKIAGDVLREAETDPTAVMERIRRVQQERAANPQYYVEGVEPTSTQIGRASTGLENRIVGDARSSSSPIVGQIENQREASREALGAQAAQAPGMVGAAIPKTDLSVSFGLSGVNPQGQASVTLKNMLLATEEAADSSVKKLWSVPELENAAIYKNKSIQSLFDHIDSLSPSQQALIDPKILNVLDQLAQTSGTTIPLSFVQDLRSQVLGAARQEAKVGNRFASYVHGDLGSKIADIINDPKNIRFGDTSGAARTAWADARNATADYYKQFGPDFVKSALAETAAGSAKIAPESLMGKMFTDKNAVQNFRELRNAVGLEAERHASDWIVGQLTKNGTNISLTEAQVAKFLADPKTAGIVDQIPGLRNRIESIGQKAGESALEARARQLNSTFETFANGNNPQALSNFLNRHGSELKAILPEDQRPFIDALERSADVLRKTQATGIAGTNTLDRLLNNDIFTILYGRAAGTIADSAVFGLAANLITKAMGVSVPGAEIMGAIGGQTGVVKNLANSVRGFANNTIFGATQEQARALLQQAMIDPDLRVALMQKPTASNVESLTETLKKAGKYAPGYAAEKAMPGALGYGRDEVREGRATGGKVGGSIAQRLVAAAEKAHKYHQKTTEEILDAPDETVVKALAVAKKNI